MIVLLSDIMRERMEYIMQDHNNLKDYKNRIDTVRLRKSEFTPEGEQNPIEYYQLLLDVELNGEPETLKFKCSEANAKLLKASAVLEREKTFLDD